MRLAIRTISGVVALAFIPALMAAQVKPDPKAMQGGKKADSAAMMHDMKGMSHEAGHDETSGWKQLDAFHKLLQDTWHPAQNGDLKPARAKAAEFVAGAETWAKSKGPAKCDNEMARKAIPGVVSDAKAFGNAVAGSASDDAVKAALKKAHDAFEMVAMPCMMGATKGMEHTPPRKP